MLSDYLTKNGVHFGEDYEGFSGQFPAELIILAHFARKSNVTEIMEIGFNAKFLKEMLSTLDGDQVQLRLSAPNRAGLVIPNENERDEDITMLIMPMMLNNY
jgi:DNA polymerase III sliding clamp (beta) subunit (PCNA family)